MVGVFTSIIKKIFYQLKLYRLANVQQLEALNRNVIEKLVFALVNLATRVKNVIDVATAIMVIPTAGDVAAILLALRKMLVIILVFASAIQMDSVPARQMYQENGAILAKTIHLVLILKIMKVVQNVSVLEGRNIVAKLVILGTKKEEMTY